MIDIGLRHKDVEAMTLQSEIVDIDVKERAARRDTVYQHGATDDEVEFLLPRRGDCHRVELNAMTSPQLVAYVEAALQANGVKKVIPDSAVIKEQARHRLQIKLTNQRLAVIADDIAREAAAVALPRNLARQVRRLLDRQPELSWDQALARIIG